MNERGKAEELLARLTARHAELKSWEPPTEAEVAQLNVERGLRERARSLSSTAISRYPAKQHRMSCASCGYAVAYPPANGLVNVVSLRL